MTPMAARLFRSGAKPLIEVLARAQFFEVTALVDMAAEMVDADIAAGCTEFSDFARLPAPVSVVEYHLLGHRTMLLCEEAGDEVGYIAFFDDDGYPRPQLKGGFRRGSSDHLPGEWFDASDSFGSEGPRTMMASDPRMGVMTSITSALEKLLCVINQPGLVDRDPRPTDKRVSREARKTKLNTPDVWHQCRIRPGEHSRPSAITGFPGEPVMPLHYVRKYFKPSVQKWIDGYWRGDLALGLHLKWYSPRPPLLNSERSAA